MFYLGDDHAEDAKEILQGKAYHWHEWNICRGRDCLYVWSDSAALELSNGSNGWFRFILDGKLATMYSSGSPENGNDNSGTPNISVLHFCFGFGFDRKHVLRTGRNPWVKFSSIFNFFFFLLYAFLFFTIYSINLVFFFLNMVTAGKLRKHLTLDYQIFVVAVVVFYQPQSLLIKNLCHNRSLFLFYHFVHCESWTSIRI